MNFMVYNDSTSLGLSHNISGLPGSGHSLKLRPDMHRMFFHIFAVSQVAPVYPVGKVGLHEMIRTNIIMWKDKGPVNIIKT